MSGEIAFVPAKNKLEVVVRISNLTNSGPESLGPGSKERKSVVANLARGLGVSFNETDSKQIIAAKIATAHGHRWSRRHESVGQTLTLEGLNLLLEIGSLVLNSDDAKNGWPSTPHEQSKAIATAISALLPSRVDGKTAVQELKAAGDQWRKTEWHGIYFEMKCIPPLVSKFGGGRKKIHRTVFDYVNGTVWDFKAHTEVDGAGKPKTECPLNDSESIEEAVTAGGFGLVVLCVESKRTIEFAEWHKKFRGKSGSPTRKLVEWFSTISLDFYWIPNRSRLKTALANGEIKDFNQGKNSNGKPRPPKYSLVLDKARKSDLIVHQVLI